MKEKQKQILSEIMVLVEKSGLYDNLVYTAAEYYSEGYGNNRQRIISRRCKMATKTNVF